VGGKNVRGIRFSGAVTGWLVADSRRMVGTDFLGLWGTSRGRGGGVTVMLLSGDAGAENEVEGDESP
jgi:hypothetical protein